MYKLPPLNAVKSFEAAARHVSFTKAAAELSVTPGAVSRQVALLEEWLGLPLFQRGPSQLTLTEPGRRFLRDVSEAFERIAAASAHARQHAAPSVVRVNAPPTFTMHWLIPRISVFQRRRPDVELRLTTSVKPVSFQDDIYDIAIRGQQSPADDCRSIPFMSELIVPICHVDLRDSFRLEGPEDLKAHTLIHYATEPYSWTDWLTTIGAQGLRPAANLNFEQMYLAMQAASEGLGLVIVPLFLAIDDILAGKLCAPFGELGVKRRTYYANSQLLQKDRASVEDFFTWLQHEGQGTEQSIRAWAGSIGWEKFPDF